MTTPKAKFITVQVAASTDVGSVREHNEDCFILADLTTGKRDARAIRRVGPAGILFGVCDGMGGAAAGEVASLITVEILVKRMAKTPSYSSLDRFAGSLSSAVIEAGEAIRRNVQVNPSRKGMGTTCTAVAVRGDTLFVGQVGDSRAYVFRSGVLTQITKDQSLVGQLIELGQLNPEEAENFGASNVILQAVGSTKDLCVELTSLRLQRGDRVLVCSDGLHGLVPDDAIASVLAHRSVDAASKRLIELANLAGGKDNITVVVVEFEGRGLQSPIASEPAGCFPYTVLGGPQPAQIETIGTHDVDVTQVIRLPVTFGAKHLIGIGAALLMATFLLMWSKSGPETRPHGSTAGAPLARVTETRSAPRTEHELARTRVVYVNSMFLVVEPATIVERRH